MYLRRHDVISVPAKGGVLSIVDSVTGEFVRELPVPAGCYSVGALVRACRRGQHLVSAGGVTVIERSAGGYVQRGQGHFESAANPSYRVTNAMRLARNLEANLRRQEVLERAVTAKLEALKRAGENEIPLPATPPAAPVAPAEPVSDQQAVEQPAAE